MPAEMRAIHRFCNFELDPNAGELRRDGRILHLERIPLELLILLIECSGQIVSREEILERVWGKGIFIDIESSINTAVRKIRRALDDDAEAPRFIATVPAKGYRFIAEVNEPAPHAVGIPLSQTAFTDHDHKTSKSGDGPTGERRRLTVLYCDLMNPTSRVQQRDPEEWWESVAGYHRAVAQAIELYGGHVGQYRGDGVIAYFGWPQAHEHDAEYAVRAGLAIIEAIAQLNDHSAILPKPSPRIGIDTGAVMVEAGAGKDANLFGESPDIARQAEAAAEPGTMIITAETHRLVPGLFVMEDCGAQVLKGIERSTQLYRVIQPSGAQGRLEAAAERGLTPFVGREEELRLLMSRWERVCDGEGQVALIVGEPGIGKSRLVQRFKEQIAVTAHRWIETMARPFFQSAPFYPVEQMLRDLMAWRRDESAEVQLVKLESVLAMAGLKLAEAVPLIAPLLSLTIPANYLASPLSPEQKRRRLLAALVDLVLGAARAQPLVVVTEDLHWADPSSLELIQLLVEQGRTARLLLIYTARPEFHAQWPQRAHHMCVTLDRLSARDVRTMVGQVAERTPLSDETVATVVERTGGVPLFVEELTRAVLESGDGKLTGRSIPATLHDSLLARLDRLGSAKEVAEVGAVLGSEFSYELLHAVHAVAEAGLQKALCDLVDADLLYERGLAPEAIYRFKHALIRDAAYEALLMSRRKQLHRKIARTISEQFPTLQDAHPQVLAQHWTEAGEVEPAIGAWTKAAKSAESRNAFHEALHNYQQALDLLRLSSKSAGRDIREMEIRQSVAWMFNITRGYAAPETINAVESAVALAEKNGDLTKLANLLTSRAATHLISGDFAGAAAILNRAFEVTARQSSPVNLPFLHQIETIVRYCRGDLAGSEKHFNAWFESSNAPGLVRSNQVAVNALAFGGFNAWMCGRADSARQRVSQMIAVAKEGSPFDIANSSYCAAHLEVYLREYGRVEALSMQAIELGEKHGFPNPVIRGRGTLGLALAHLGRTAEGVALIQQCLAGLREMGTRMGITTRLSDLAKAQGLQGSVGDALETVELALRTLPDELSQRPEALRVRGELRLKQGEVRLAEASYREAIELAQKMGAKAWELRATMSMARLLRDTGRRDEALARLDAIYNWFTEGFDTFDLKDAKILLNELIG